jgi:hypothetical protein
MRRISNLVLAWPAWDDWESWQFFASFYQSLPDGCQIIPWHVLPPGKQMFSCIPDAASHCQTFRQ